MRILIKILLPLLLTFKISAQKVDVVYQSIAYKGFYIHPQKIDAFDKLPERIKEIASVFIRNRFGEYYSRIHFVHAQILPLDSVLKNEIKDLKEQSVVNPIPYYDLNYAFADTSLGIKQYWINIGLTLEWIHLDK